MTHNDSDDTLASDREREAIAGQLQSACVEGRLTLEEYAQRVEHALLARTRGELDTVVRDLPTAPVIPGEQATFCATTLGSMKRTGRWHLGEHLRVRALLGSCDLDLRDATISSRVSTIEFDVTLGSVEVVVPVGVGVDITVGGFANSRNVRLTGPPIPPGAPLIRLVGVVRFGSLTVRNARTLSERIQERIRGALAP